MKRFFLLMVAMLIGSIAISVAAPTNKSYKVTSPDGTITVDVKLNHKISYSVYSNNNLMLKDCDLSLQLADGEVGFSPKVKKVKTSVIDETVTREIPMKNAEVRNHCNVLSLTMADNYTVEFRVFDCGFAYRFILDKGGEVEILNEEVGLNFPENYKAHISKTGSFKTSYEVPYSHTTTQEYGYRDEMIYLPVLLETPSGEKILISEANLKDYPAMFFRSTGNNGLTSLFPKYPLEVEDDGDRSQKILKEANYIAKTSGSRDLPWRMFVISKQDKDLLEQEMVYNLSDPNEIGDTSWVRTGKVAWDWWNHWQVWGVDFRAGINFETYKYYIDFASKYGIEYIIMDEGWARNTRDPFNSNPDINLPELIKYGKSKNVDIVLWLTWLTTEKNFSLFEKFAEWGIAGVKIDFMDRSDQWMVNFYERVAKEAAKHKLFVDFHGSFKPAGLERRYPNIISYEGIRGLEQGGNCKPENTIFIPFIRNAVGPADFTPGSMFSAQPQDNRSSFSNAMGSGTRAYQMALYVVLESGIQMLADTPTRYLQEAECTEYIASVPVIWDETKVLDAKVGEYVVTARRKGDKWFIGAITNNDGRTLEVNLDFLKDGEHSFTSFEDGINADRQAMDYKKRTSKVNKDTKLTIKMVRNGGFCGVIE
ncbi:MAG: glycoside hydrolase family 97 protein [Alistipes sp.]|nr:glycoside hydrolase family 97 protein [Alistipes sp.]